jgi:hypothetical protein
MFLFPEGFSRFRQDLVGFRPDFVFPAGFSRFRPDLLGFRPDLVVFRPNWTFSGRKFVFPDGNKYPGGKCIFIT